MAMMTVTAMAPNLLDEPVKKYRDLHLPLQSTAIEVTEETAVFVVSPHRRSLRRRQRALEQRRQSTRTLFAFGLKQVPSELTCGEKKLPLAAGAACAQGSKELESRSESTDDEESGSVAEKEESEREEDELHAGIMRRAAEQTMMVNLKQLAQKQQLRYGRRRAAVGMELGMAEAKAADMADRLRTNKMATNFTELYSRTVEILENNMTTIPPRRRHSWHARAFDSPVGTPLAATGTTTFFLCESPN